jgi:drug/metabolite transporter (DMT)-like permease
LTAFRFSVILSPTCAIGADHLETKAEGAESRQRQLIKILHYNTWYEDLSRNFNADAGERRGFLYALLAVSFFATSPVLVRWAEPLSPYERTAWRMVVGAAAVASLAVIQGAPPRYQARDLPRFLLYGAIAALHFLTYIASLDYTTIAHSLSIVYTAPIFVTIFSALFLGEPVARHKYLGVAITVVGVAILAGFEPRFSGRMLLGDALALVSAITFGLYSVAGRSERERYPLLHYAAGVYGLAALWLSGPALVYSAGGYGWRQILALLGLGLLPTALGHTLYNAALRRIHATYCNLIATQEVTGGVILGIVLLGETPGWTSIAGVATTLVGIATVLL